MSSANHWGGHWRHEKHKLCRGMPCGETVESGKALRTSITTLCKLSVCRFEECLMHYSTLKGKSHLRAYHRWVRWRITHCQHLLSSLTENRKFVVTSGTGGCHSDSFWYRQRTHILHSLLFSIDDKGCHDKGPLRLWVCLRLLKA